MWFLRTVHFAYDTLSVNLIYSYLLRSRFDQFRDKNAAGGRGSVRALMPAPQAAMGGKLAGWLKPLSTKYVLIDQGCPTRKERDVYKIPWRLSHMRRESCVLNLMSMVSPPNLYMILSYIVLHYPCMLFINAHDLARFESA